MLILAFILTIAGTWFLNQSGSLTTQNKGRAIGLVLNIIALVLFSFVYGGVRGTFIYLGVWALVGMAVTFALPYMKKQKA